MYGPTVGQAMPRMPQPGLGPINPAATMMAQAPNLMMNPQGEDSGFGLGAISNLAFNYMMMKKLQEALNPPGQPPYSMSGFPMPGLLGSGGGDPGGLFDPGYGYAFPGGLLSDIWPSSGMGQGWI